MQEIAGVTKQKQWDQYLFVLLGNNAPLPCVLIITNRVPDFLYFISVFLIKSHQQKSFWKKKKEHRKEWTADSQSLPLSCNNDTQEIRVYLPSWSVVVVEHKVHFPHSFRSVGQINMSACWGRAYLEISKIWFQLLVAQFDSKSIFNWEKKLQLSGKYCNF